MARPTKKNDEIKLKLADSIRSGLTVKDSCEVSGISTSSFNRWRASDPSFNKGKIRSGCHIVTMDCMLGCR